MAAIGSIVAMAMALTMATAQADEPARVALHGVDAHGQAFDLTSLRGNLVAVTFVSRYTQDDAARINAALGRHGELKVVSVVDFVGIPAFVRNYAMRKVAESDGRVQHLCDVDGALGRQFGAATRQRVSILIVDRDGSLRGRFDGTAQLDAAERMVEDVRAQAKR